MSKVIHVEKLEVFGKLFTEFGTFPMLKMLPSKMEVPFLLKESGVLSFYVIDLDGFGKNILVMGNFIIKPMSEQTFQEVKFALEDENIKVESAEV